MAPVRMIALACLAAAGPAAAQAPSAFHAIQLRGGGHVVVRPGPAAQARLLRGDPRFTRILDQGDGRLRIDNCPQGCPRGYAAEVEVVSPQVAALSVSNGGTLEVRGGFPAQASLALAVHDGGTVDARAITAGDASAAVAEGGRILVRAEASLSAVIADGGAVTYWGRPRLSTQVAHGGVVRPGRAADIGLSLAELAPPPPPLPPLPPIPGVVPPVPPVPPQPW